MATDNCNPWRNRSYESLKAPRRPAGVIIGSPEWVAYMDALIQHWTGWDGLQDMCNNNPTLAITKNTSPEEASAIGEMRAAYQFMNGKEAYPPNGTYGSGI